MKRGNAAMPVIHRTSTTAISRVAPWLFEKSMELMPPGNTGMCCSERNLNEHEHLFVKGGIQTHVYLVLEGVFGMYKLLADGRRQISNFAYPGDIIGLDCVGSHINSGEALSPSVVRCIPVSAIEKMIRIEPGFGQALLLLSATELAETREQILSLGRKSAAEKLATFLLRIVNRATLVGHDGNTISIPMKRCEIADFLGLTIETVSRTFTKLKVSRVIRLKPNAQVEILDLKKLESIADGGASTAIH